jgi:Zn-finger nucleic acid-binding protein
MRHCPACGVALAREEVPDEGAELACPSCSTALKSIQLGESRLRECDGCGGVWTDYPTLHAIRRARDREARFSSGRPPAGEPPAPSRARPVAYLPCPVCGALMNRQNVSRVIVDTCREHGIWFERGELQRVIGFSAAPSWVW